MPHRMEIELTSAKDDGSFTWRAAGARQPRGTLPASLLPGGAKVGDVLRVEAEVEIDGISVLSVLPPKEKAPVLGKIEVIGPPRPTSGVTTVLAERRSGRGPRDRGPGDDRGDRRPRRPSAGRDGASDARERDRDRPPRSDRSERGPRTEPTERGERPERTSRTERVDRTERAERAERTDRTDRRRGPSDRDRTEAERGPGGRSGRRPEAADRKPSPRKGPHRLEPGTKHRDEFFGTLPPEQREIAERLAVGGMPALRKAIADEQQRAKSDGRPVVNGEPIIELAESLLPDVRGAVWLDRAEAAAEHVDELGLRDLRATVAAAEPRTEEGRELQRRLKEGLDRRVTKLRQDWEEHLTQALKDGRVLQALRLSARPPEPTARFPGSLAEPLATQAGAAMTSETSPERWLALLEAALASPVRRQIKPAGLPEDPSGEVASQARLAASRIPALATLLGMAMPPPPRPLASERPLRRVPRPPRPSGTSAQRVGRAPSAPSAPPASAPPAATGAEPPAAAAAGTERPTENGSEHPVVEEPTPQPADQR